MQGSVFIAVLVRKYVVIKELLQHYLGIYVYHDLHNNTPIHNAKKNLPPHIPLKEQDTLYPLQRNESAQIESHASMEFATQESMGQIDIQSNKETKYPKNETYFNRLKQAQKADHTTITKLSGNNTKAHFFSKMLYKMPSARILFCVLPPNSLHGAQVNIEKAQLQKKGAFDSIALSHAQYSGLIPYNYECRYFLQNQTKTHFTFQIFCVAKDLLQNHALQYAGKLFCLNLFELFCGLRDLFPALIRYTIIFQDTKKHALCHYANGFLEVSIVLERTEALQNHYHLIRDFGEIFYCDFSGNAGLLCDFTDVATLFEESLQDCLHILALHHIRTKPLENAFYAQKFYEMRFFLKTLLYGAAFFFVVYLGFFCYDTYQYHAFLAEQEQEYRRQVEYVYQKKQSYPSMYERVYQHALENKSFRFCLQQDYIPADKGFIWKQSVCTYNAK